ncbi:hypothetical protein OH77DRAFT_1415564, partial [Trametes cingulata]
MSAPCASSRPSPWTAEWVIKRLREDDVRAIVILRNWVHKKRQQEATHETLQQIRELSDDDAIMVLRELARPKQFIRGGRGNQMDIPLTLTTLDDRRSFPIRALLDSGCTGSSIDINFVRRNNIQTRKLPRPIPVYNADNTLNKGGPISEYVEALVRIGDHSEKMALAVT